MSNINHLSINENFPVAGQDNDTQVFRDNFDTIKTNLRLAQEEISDLEDNTARTDQDTSFNNSVISEAVFRNNRDKVVSLGSAPEVSIDYSNGNYQILRIGVNTTLVFQEFPVNTTLPQGVGKVVLELYSDGSNKTITLDPSNAIAYKKKSSDPSFTWANNSFVVGSSSNPVVIEVWRYSDENIFINYLGTFA